MVTLGKLDYQDPMPGLHNGARNVPGSRCSRNFFCRPHGSGSPHPPQVTFFFGRKSRPPRMGTALSAESPTGNVLSDQFVENVVVKWDTFAGAGAFDVLDEVDSGIACATDRAIPGSPNDLLEPLLL